jgi:hypothetical protein
MRCKAGDAQWLCQGSPFKRYYVTPKGFSEKSRLIAGSQRICQYFARADGRSRLVLAGRGELAEIAILAAWGEGLTLLALLDSQTDRDQHYGVRVIRSLDEIGPFDAVVIADSRTPQQAYEDMRERLSEAQVLAPPWLKITRDRADLIAAAQETEQA